MYFRNNSTPITTEDCATVGGWPIGLELIGSDLIISYGSIKERLLSYFSA